MQLRGLPARSVGGPAGAEAVNNAADRTTTYAKGGKPDCGDNACGIPRRNCYLPYAKGVQVVIPAGKTQGSIEWKAQRDVAIDQILINGLTALLADLAAAVGAKVSVSYCNDLLIDHVDWVNYFLLTMDRPALVIGYKSPKEVEITIDLEVASAETLTFDIDLSGDQSNGCCDGFT